MCPPPFGWDGCNNVGVWQVLELDPGDAAMQKTVKRLEPIVEERREKMKDEMMGAHHLEVMCCSQL